MRKLDRTCALCGGVLYRGPAEHPEIYCRQDCEDWARKIAVFKGGLGESLAAADALLYAVQPLAAQPLVPATPCHYCEQPSLVTVTVEGQPYCQSCYAAMAGNVVPMQIQLALDQATRECADDYLYILATVPSRRGTPLKETV